MSKFIVSARKYRPVRFDEVVGQEHVSLTLKNALQNDQLAHAFLFCGPRGVGKTTCARILAKVLNCENVSKDHEACNECSSCSSFNENASFNITELDAASNNSVDHIRALIEQVRFQPQQGQYKVFIIDEVHMLSQQAFNAFLKTLEEPPPYAVFILATTEKHKIIPTILSRCQIFDFRRIQVPAIVNHLQTICKQESIEAEKTALHIIAQKADGALRDALSIFDRIASSLAVDAKGKKESITYKHVIDSLNVLDYDYFFQVVDALLIEDAAAVMMVFDDILKNGFEEDIFILGLSEHLRSLMVCKDESTIALLEQSDELKDRFLAQAKKSPTSFLLSALNIANDCDVNYRMAKNKRLHVEIALIKMAYINRAVDLSKQITAAPSPEKKTADSRNKVLNKQSTPKSDFKTVPTETPKIETREYKESLQPATPVAKKKSIPATPPTYKANLKIDSKFSSPKLINLDELEKTVVQESEQKLGQNEIDLESVQNAWKGYIETIKSPSAKLNFKKAILQVEGQVISVAVGTQMSKSMIQDENRLMEYLRKELNSNKLELNIAIDPNLSDHDQTAKPNKAIGDKEKYELMLQVNPVVEKLRERFDLKPDQ